MFAFLVACAILIVVFVAKQKQLKRKREIINSVTTCDRGEYSERDLIYRLVKGGIPASTIFHDIYVPYKGGYAQIDLVVPTNVGVFVFEVKDYSGWIFGNGIHEKWTQVLAYGQEKHTFYNPIKQNERHMEALKSALPQFQNIPFFSVIVFYGSSEIKKLSNVPENCRVAYPNQVVSLVKGSIESLLPAPYTDKWEVMRLLKTAMYNGCNDDIVASHLRRAKMASCGKYYSTYDYKPRFYRKSRSYFH